MANSKELFSELVNKVTLAESREEIESMIYLLFEHQLRLTRADVLAKKILTAVPQSRLDEIIGRINSHEPIQYILGETEFYGRTFFVNPSVLIPRPETELVVTELLSAFPPPGFSGMTIVDIGTGSGCLAVTLALELPEAKVFGTDISAAALMTAGENAKRLSAKVNFSRHDILSAKPLPAGLTAIVSNPPYVTLAEKETMNSNVKDYEPPEALFVPNDDPILFYSAIARAAKTALLPNGKFFVEINERFGKEVCTIFSGEGFTSIRVVKDMAGKERVVTGSR